jgi:hypothetical protein
VTGAEADPETRVLRDKVAAEMAIGAWWLDNHGEPERAAALRGELAAWQTRAVRKRDQVTALLRARIADGTLKPGQLVPAATELAKETGFAVRTCQAGVAALLDEGALTRVSATSRPRVAGGWPAGGWQDLGVGLARSLAGRRREAGVTQEQLAAVIGVSVTTVGHAETGRLWQGRPFWENADAALGAGGILPAQYDEWRAAAASEALAALELAAPEPVSEQGDAASAAQGAAPDAPDGIVITLPCDPMRVTVRWGDGSVTTVQPSPG